MKHNDAKANDVRPIPVKTDDGKPHSGNPYEALPPRAFWKLAAAAPEGGEISQLWAPKFAISAEDGIATAGSCFAQNIGRALKSRGMNWVVTEKPPKSIPRSLQAAHGYGLFSFRTGNIYTPALLHQWLTWGFEPAKMDREIWEQDGRFFDPFRPSVRPMGFDSAEEVLTSRQETAEAVRRAVLEAKVFLFTPGLTEAWVNTESQMIYPACPGTVQGRFDPERHRCVNFGFAALTRALGASFDLMKTHNPSIKLLLTVSPVPITATMTGQHALAASTYTKSVLRAMAGEFANSHADADYFPSYDLVTPAALGGAYFNENRRTITPEGVDLVMKHFFEALGRADAGHAVPSGDIVCEDEILEYYGK